MKVVEFRPSTADCLRGQHRWQVVAVDTPDKSVYQVPGKTPGTVNPDTAIFARCLNCQRQPGISVHDSTRVSALQKIWREARWRVFVAPSGNYEIEILGVIDRAAARRLSAVLRAAPLGIAAKRPTSNQRNLLMEVM